MPDKSCFIRLVVRTGSTEVNLERGFKKTHLIREKRGELPQYLLSTPVENASSLRPVSVCDLCFRIPEAAGLHSYAQRKLPQWPWYGRHHDPHAWSGWRNTLWKHATGKNRPRADGCSALRPRHELQHGWHAPSGGVWNVSPSSHEQEGWRPLHAPRPHKFYTQQVSADNSGPYWSQ